MSNEPSKLDTSAIKSRQDFVVFLNHLLADYQENSEAWQNQQLDDFLEALAQYATDIDGYYHNMAKAGTEAMNADSANWRVFADMLRGATIYE